MENKRETFTSNFGLLMTMIGVAVGLGNVWRFPYLVGKFGGASFVLFYIIAVFFIGIPALMAEWTLGRYTRRGPLGAFERGGLPGGKAVGVFFICIVLCATAYYNNTLGWVGFYGISQVVNAFGGKLKPEMILPPETGFNKTSFFIQLLMTGTVLLSAVAVLLKGLKKGIEKISKLIIPGIFLILLILIVRALTLPGSEQGLKWYLGGIKSRNLTASVMVAALGQAVFSLSLGGTFMVVYGSYLKKSTSIPKHSTFTALGDLLVGLLAGLAIFPAVFALNLEPGSGPGLIFHILPKTFALMPLGQIFALIFFLGLFGAAFLSAIAAFEVVVAGLTDNTRISRKTALWLTSGTVFILALPSMINLKVFVPWDLFFGSGMQILGTFLAVITTVWCIKRSAALREISAGSGKPFPKFLFWWMRIVIPLAVLFVGLNWLLEEVFHINIFK